MRQQHPTLKIPVCVNKPLCRRPIFFSGRQWKFLSAGEEAATAGMRTLPRLSRSLAGGHHAAGARKGGQTFAKKRWKFNTLFYMPVF
jgi:hypothetical protein